MNKADILIVDGNSVCYRAIHTTGELKYNREYTGVKYGFFSQLFTILEKYEPKNICFVWDSRLSKRKEIYPTYKEKRSKKKKEMSKEEKIFYGKCFEQFDEIYEEILPRLGFKNNFKEKGLEGDDLIASICLNNKGKKVIATSDNDLYQMLNVDTVIYDIRKKKEYNQNDFIKEYNIAPDRWAEVKCIAGCDTDEIKGIKGIGIKTAIKFLNEELNERSKVYKKIMSSDNDIICWSNEELIILPFKGTPKIVIDKKDKISIGELKSVFIDNGFNSFCEKNKINEWRRLLC